MKFIALKTKDGESKGEIAFCCRTLRVSRQGFSQYLANKNRPWKYQPLADAMLEILSEDECNDTLTISKIDGAVATIMAPDRAIRCGNDTSASVYDSRGLLFI